MNQSLLAKLLRVVTILFGILGAIFVAGIIPATLKDFGLAFPEFRYLVQPYSIAILIGAIPIYIALALFWLICSRIATNNSFCRKNADAFKHIGWLAIIDTVYCLLGTVILAVLNASNAGVVIIALGVITFGAAVSIAAFTLSYLVLKASLIQEENDLTV